MSSCLKSTIKLTVPCHSYLTDTTEDTKCFQPQNYYYEAFIAESSMTFLWSIHLNDTISKKKLENQYNLESYLIYCIQPDINVV